MEEANLTNLAANVAARLYGYHEQVCVALIRELAAGQPVVPAHLAARLALDEPAIAEVLQHMSDINYDASGHIVGFGVSLTPTAHQFTINRQSLYTWCALDTFMYTALLDQPTQVLSHCPITGCPIALAMTPAHISELTPASAVISLVIPDGSITNCRRSAFCNHGHFFASAAVGAHWLQNHPNGLLLTVADAHHLGRLLAQHRLLRASDCGTGGTTVPELHTCVER
jgi:alkylmercury lyase